MARDSALRFRRLDWFIAWRHLRVGDDRPAWVVPALLVGLYLLVVGGGFAVYAAHIDPVGGEAIVPGFDPGDRGMTAQRAYGFLAAGTLAVGGMLLLFGALAYVFNLLASVITLSVLLGCMALVVVLSLMTGLEEDLRHKILDQRGHVRITRKDGRPFGDHAEVVAAVLERPGIAGASPYLEGEIMLRSGLQRQAGILIGIDPQRHTTISNLPDIVVAGDYDYLERPEEIPEPDPFARTDDAPFRLRHLAPKRKRTKGARSRAGSKGGGVPRAGAASGAGGGGRGTDGAAVAATTDAPGVDPPAESEPTADGPASGGTSGAEAPFGTPAGVSHGDESVAAGPAGSEPAAGDPEPGGTSGAPAGVRAGSAVAGDVSDLPPPPATRTFGALGRLPPPPVGVRAPPPEDDWEDPSQVLGRRREEVAPDAPGPAGAAEAAPPEGAETARAPEDAESPAEGSAKVLPALVIGREMEMELGVTVGDRVQLITPIGRLTPAGRMPGILSARVGAIFYSGMYEFDRKNVYARLEVVQAFLRTGDRVSGVEVRLVDPEDVDAGKAAVQAAITALGRDDELLVQDWRDLNRNLFSAMFLEKVAMFVALLFVVLVASFGILASNLMSVIEKAKDIAIMKAMGATDQQILRVFTAEGLVVGLLGSVGGIGAGLLLAWALGRFGLPISEAMLYSEELPVVVEPTEVVLVGVAALAIVWLSSLYPAFVASRLPPVAGLRKADR